jgi:hypothetical protein
MANKMSDKIIIFYGIAEYVGEDSTSYVLKTNSGTHEYSKNNQLVFASSKDFEHFKTTLALKFGEIPIKTKKMPVMETSRSEQGVAEGYQLDEGAVETITALVKKIPGIGKYYQLAQQYKPQLIQILKTSKSGKEVKQKMEQLIAQQPEPVAESGLLKQLGGLAVGGGSILSTMWMNAMGMIDGVLAHAAAGEIGGAVASGSILGLIPVALMLFAAMLLFKGAAQSSDEKAQQFQAQRGQQGMTEGSVQPLNIQQLATISDEALDNAYHYGRSQPGNTFGWQANLKSAEYAAKMINAGITDIEKISDAIHKGWNVTAQAFVQNPEQFGDTEKLKAAGKLEAKLQQRAQLMKQNYAQLPEEEKEKDRVVARALLQALKGQQGVAESAGFDLELARLRELLGR